MYLGPSRSPLFSWTRFFDDHGAFFGVKMRAVEAGPALDLDPPALEFYPPYSGSAMFRSHPVVSWPCPERDFGLPHPYGQFHMVQQIQPASRIWASREALTLPMSAISGAS